MENRFADPEGPGSAQVGRRQKSVVTRGAKNGKKWRGACVGCGQVAEFRPHATSAIEAGRSFPPLFLLAPSRVRTDATSASEAGLRCFRVAVFRDLQKISGPFSRSRPCTSCAQKVT